MFRSNISLIYPLLGLLFLFALVTLASAFAAEGWLGALQSATDLTLATLTMCIVLTLANYLFRFLRWNRYLNLTRNHKIPFIRHCLIYVAGFSMTTTPGKVGELARAAWLEQYEVSFQQVTAVFLLERTLDVIALLILSAFTITLFLPNVSEAVGLLVLAATIGIMLLALSALPFLCTSLARRQTRFKPTFSRIEEAVEKLGSTEISFGLALGLLAWFAEGLAFWLILKDLVHLDLGLLQMVGIYATSLLAGAISFVPGGLVATEMTLGAGLAVFDVPAAKAIAIVVITRLITLWFGVLVGFIALVAIGRPLPTEVSHAS